MVVLRSEGETSMVFFWKCYATAEAKKHQKSVFLILKLSLLVVLGTPGNIQGKYRRAGGTSSPFRAISSTFWEVILEPFEDPKSLFDSPRAAREPKMGSRNEVQF